jgi:hypothetical protein
VPKSEKNPGVLHFLSEVRLKSVFEKKIYLKPTHASAAGAQWCRRPQKGNAGHIVESLTFFITIIFSQATKSSNSKCGNIQEHIIDENSKNL